VDSSLDCTLLRKKVLQIAKGVCPVPTFLNLEDFPSKKSAIQAENHVSLSSSGGPGIQVLHDEERLWWIPAWIALFFEGKSSRSRKAFAECKRLSPSGGLSFEEECDPG
jgi:hypothetical protein